jgi:parallel beta-helix repeat protein
VRTIRIEFASASGQRCCLAVEPTRLPTDPVSGRRFLVLAQLADGPATIGLAGFPTDVAPGTSPAPLCPTEPADAAEPCEASGPATPSFLSEPHRVNIVTGTETDAGDIPVFATPFLLNLLPAVGATALNPVAISFTVVDAAAGINATSVSARILQVGQSSNSVPVNLTPCDDASSPPCSGGGLLRVRGFHVAGAPQSLSVGAADLQIQARNLGAPPRTLDLTYSFAVRSAVGTTPTPVPVTVIVRNGANIAATARTLPAGSTIIAAPGVYPPIVFEPGDLRGGLTLLADVTGERTDTVPAAVVINVRGQQAGITVAGQTDVTVDGFTIRGAAGAGILVQDSSSVILRHCAITDTRGDGVTMSNSSGGLIFNNLVFSNSGAGIRVRGVDGVQIINNTVYSNDASGIVVGDAGQSSDAVFVRNNLLNRNEPAGIVVHPSTGGYDGDYNLNTDGYGDAAPVGGHDIVEGVPDPLFIAPAIEDFHLARGLAGSTSAAVNGGDPDTDPALEELLAARTTQTDGTLDVPPVDVGYHYPPPAAPAARALTRPPTPLPAE